MNCNAFNRTALDFSSKNMEKYSELICNRDLNLELSSDNLIKFSVKI
jgi:hypothetical protein